MLASVFKVLKWIVLIVIGLYAVLALLIESFDRYIAAEKGSIWYYSDVPNYKNMEIKQTPSGLRYLSLGAPDKQALLLIHGAPGSIMDFKAFCKDEKLQENYRLIVVERPGYGGTKPSRAEPSVKKHVLRIAEILDTETKPAVVLGHSYGGPIAVLLGAVRPEKIERIIGVSGAYDPDNEVTMGISHYIKYDIFKYLLPRMVWSSNVEKLTHPDGLREVLPMYKDVSVPVVLIHGNADTLVPYENSTFVQALLANVELITLEGKDHPVHMTDTQYFLDYLNQ